MAATWCLPAGIGLKVAAVHAGVRSPPLLCLTATDEGEGRSHHRHLLSPLAERKGGVGGEASVKMLRRLRTSQLCSAVADAGVWEDMTSENNGINEDVDSEVNFFNPYDFSDSDSFDSSDDDDENCFDTCENNSLVPLDDNDGLESFTFDESLSNELANDLHEICCDDDMNGDASLSDLNDIKFVNFFDDCLDDAVYIHELIGEDNEEMGGDLRDVLSRPRGETKKVREKNKKKIKFGKETGPGRQAGHESSPCPASQMPPKTRYKEMAKKSRHDVGGLSSEAAAAPRERVAPGDRAMGHLSYLQRARVEELAEKKVSGGFYFDFPLLDSYGCREEVERMTAQPFWDHLFSWRDDTYVLVVYEFIATFSATDESHHSIPSVKFTVFGQEHHLSVDQLGTYLGFYTQNHMNEEDYRNLPNDFDSDTTVEAYWHRITGGNAGIFIGAKPNTKKIPNPVLKALKLLLGLTFGGRHKNLHKVYRHDLFRLWSLEMNQPIQMACMVKQWPRTQAKDKCTYMWIGPIVTRLCEALGYHRQLRREKRKTSMSPLGLEQLNRSYIPKIDDTMETFNRRMDLQEERQNQQFEAIMRQNEAFARQEERQNQQFEAIEQLRLWMEQRALSSSAQHEEGRLKHGSCSMRKPACLSSPLFSGGAR
nr:putative retrotransposon Orf1 [Ipomoea batatas]